MATAELSDVVLQLNWSDQGVVTVTPSDQDRYSVKVQKAIELLNFARQHERFQKQLKLLQNVLAQWLKDKQERVRAACLTVRDGGFLFVVVSKSAEYDEDFEDALTDLDINVAKDLDLDLIKLDVLCLPDASAVAVRTFVDPEFILPFGVNQDAERVGPHTAGEQES